LSSPLFEQEGSAICDWFYELISERRVLPCQDSTLRYLALPGKQNAIKVT
jgi:hypothetical protein